MFNYSFIYICCLSILYLDVFLFCKDVKILKFLILSVQQVSYKNLLVYVVLLFLIFKLYYKILVQNNSVYIYVVKFSMYREVDVVVLIL